MTCILSLFWNFSLNLIDFTNHLWVFTCVMKCLCYGWAEVFFYPLLNPISPNTAPFHPKLSLIHKPHRLKHFASTSTYRFCVTIHLSFWKDWVCYGKKGFSDGFVKLKYENIRVFFFVCIKMDLACLFKFDPTLRTWD